MSEQWMNMITKIVLDSNIYNQWIIDALNRTHLSNEEKKKKLREYTNQFVTHTEQAIDAIFAMEKLNANMQKEINNYPSTY